MPYHDIKFCGVLLYALELPGEDAFERRETGIIHETILQAMASCQGTLTFKLLTRRGEGKAGLRDKSTPKR
eukprot:scaffold654027_cov64-Prasinocladus_malaysianus.AAC.1